MRFAFPLFAALALLVSEGTSSSLLRSKCDPKAKGAGLDERQKTTIRDLAQIMFVEQDVQKAFDAYMPGEYIQHNPTAQSGRQWSIDFLTEIYRTPDITVSNVTAWAGEGIGMLHYHLEVPSAGINWAIMDRLRFEGTCFVEHWDVVQPIYGNETNPLAFF